MLLGLWLEARYEAGWRNVGFAAGAAYTLEDKVDNCEGKESNYNTDNAVEDGVASFGNFARITLRGDEADAADNHGDDCDNSNETKDGVDDGANIPDDILFGTVSGGFVGGHVALGNSFELGMTWSITVLIVQTAIWAVDNAFTTAVGGRGRCDKDANEADDR